MAFCGKCGQEKKEGLSFCENCGAKHDDNTVCKNCGRTLDENISFCGGCGTKNEMTTSHAIKGSNKWAWWLLVPSFFILMGVTDIIFTSDLTMIPFIIAFYIPQVILLLRDIKLLKANNIQTDGLFAIGLIFPSFYLFLRAIRTHKKGFDYIGYVSVWSIIILVVFTSFFIPDEEPITYFEDNNQTIAFLPQDETPTPTLAPTPPQDNILDKRVYFSHLNFSFIPPEGYRSQSNNTFWQHSTNLLIGLSTESRIVNYNGNLSNYVSEEITRLSKRGLTMKRSRQSLQSISGIPIEKVTFEVNNIPGLLSVRYVFSVGENQFTHLTATFLDDNDLKKEQAIIEKSIQSIQRL